MWWPDVVRHTAGSVHRAAESKRYSMCASLLHMKNWSVYRLSELPLWVFTLSNENAFNSRCLFVLTCREQKLSKHPQCNYFKLSFCDWYHIAPEKMSDSRWVFIALHILLSSLLHYNNERKKQKNRFVRLSANMLDIPFTIVLHKLLFPFIFCVSHS